MPSCLPIFPPRPPSPADGNMRLSCRAPHFRGSSKRSMTVQPVEPYSTHANEEISFADIWRTLRARRLLIVASTLVCGSAATAISFGMTPIFRAETVISVVDDDTSGQLGGLAGQLGGLANLAGVNLGQSSSKVDSMGTLSSKNLVESYIEKNNLLPVLFAKQWDSEKNAWKGDVKVTPTLWKATQVFTRDVRDVKDDKKTGLVTLGVEWKDAALAARWANDLVALANETLRQRAIEKSKANLAYLDTQLERASVVEVRQAIYRLIEAEVKNVMIAQGTNDYAFKVIDPAVVPEEKTKPKRTLMVVAASLFGLFASCVFVLMSDAQRKQQTI